MSPVTLALLGIAGIVVYEISKGSAPGTPGGGALTYGGGNTAPTQAQLDQLNQLNQQAYSGANIVPPSVQGVGRSVYVSAYNRQRIGANASHPMGTFNSPQVGCCII